MVVWNDWRHVPRRFGTGLSTVSIRNPRVLPNAHRISISIRTSDTRGLRKPRILHQQRLIESSGDDGGHLSQDIRQCRAFVRLMTMMAPLRRPAYAEAPALPRSCRCAEPETSLRFRGSRLPYASIGQVL